MSDQPAFDLLLKGGHVIDPANDIDARMDLAIKGSAIVCVAADIPIADAALVVDVAGHIVTPGILDIHTHVYPSIPGAVAYVGALNADAHLLASGVTRSAAMTRSRSFSRS